MNAPERTAEPAMPGRGVQVAPRTRDIVLLGGGHAHIEVLRRFAMHPQTGTRLSIIAREVNTPYSGMLPGHLAGHYTRAACHIDLRALCRKTGARLLHGEAIGIDLEARCVICAGRPRVAYDYLSIDIGSTPALGAIRGADTFALPIKPVDAFLARWASVERRIEPAGAPLEVVVIGGGAGGVEACLALHYRLCPRQGTAGAPVPRARFTIIADTDELLPRHARAVARRMRRALDGRAIRVLSGHRAVEVTRTAVRCEPHEVVPCDAAIVVTHAAAPRWLADTGLALDEQGFVRVGDTLQVPDHGEIFAAGDVASFARSPLLKNGVYAVRQGPLLARNLRAVAEGRSPARYVPQKRTLGLISTGDRRAIASYGSVAVEGAWVWRMKDWIDRRWMRRYQALPGMAEGAEPMRCGGCGAKVSADVLGDVLGELRGRDPAEVAIGLDAPDDAVVSRPPPGMVCVQSVDQFRSFIDDPFVFGRIGAVHCLSDIHAMGARAHLAMAIVTLPHAGARRLADDLRALLSGVLSVLDAEGVALVGGHTAEGAELALGLSVTGYARADALFRKCGLVSGDALVLTKPIGTGALLAADMRGLASDDWVAAAIETMSQSNAAAARTLTAHGVSACTDITGFGLVGHLGEMLRGSKLHVSLDAGAVPVLPGVAQVMGAGIHSTLQPANEMRKRIITNPGAAGNGLAVLFDPQTSGGLLAGVAADRAEACLRALREAGYAHAALIGRVSAGEAGRLTICGVPKEGRVNE